jgi:hypothetical protein
VFRPTTRAAPPAAMPATTSVDSDYFPPVNPDDSYGRDDQMPEDNDFPIYPAPAYPVRQPATTSALKGTSAKVHNGNVSFSDTAGHGGDQYHHYESYDIEAIPQIGDQYDESADNRYRNRAPMPVESTDATPWSGHHHHQQASVPVEHGYGYNGYDDGNANSAPRKLQRGTVYQAQQYGSNSRAHD